MYRACRACASHRHVDVRARLLSHVELAQVNIAWATKGQMVEIDELEQVCHQGANK